MASVTETVQIAARIPATLRDQLERIAKRRDRTVSYEIRQAIRTHVAAHSEPGDEDAA